MRAQRWRRLPRGAAVVTDLADVALEAEDQGRPVVLLPRDATLDTLDSRWSGLTYRAACAAVILGDDSPELAALVRHCCDRAKMNRNTGATRAKSWARNIVSNVHHLSTVPPAQSMVGEFAGVPAFIVGAGPSLSKHIELANAASAYGIVIAVNAGSVPVHGQCVLSVEAHDLGHKMAMRGSAKVLSLSCPPSMYARGSGPVLPIYTAEVSRALELLTGVPRVATSGSGSTAAVALAHTWGCDPIVLLGQDLAYTGGRVYAAQTGLDDTVSDAGEFRWSAASRGSTRAAELPPAMACPHMVQSWDRRGEVLADVGFSAVAKWLTSAAAHITTPINATEGGRHIPGWQHVTLASALRRMEPRGVTIAEIMAAAGKPCGRDEVKRWLTDTAQKHLLDAYAMGEVTRLMDAWREATPWRSAAMEYTLTRRHATSLRDAVRRSRAELTALCMDAASSI